MKKLLYVMLVFCCPMSVFSQDITGLWKGTIFNDSDNKSYRYEIVISKDKGKFKGYSHTWFLIDGKEYYGIKKINVRIAKDGKIVLQDATLVENNYPTAAPKDVYQLNVLDLANVDELAGAFVTNRTKEYDGLTGRIDLKRVSLTSQSDLMQYLHRNSIDNTLTVSK